jgi:hypothetical protein
MILTHGDLEMGGESGSAKWKGQVHQGHKSDLDHFFYFFSRSLMSYYPRSNVLTVNVHELWRKMVFFIF